MGYPPSDRPISAQFCPSLALRKSESFRGAASSGLTPRKWGSQMFPRSQGDVLGAFGCWEQPGLLKMIFTSKKSSGFQLWESVGYILDYFGVLEYLDLSVHCEKMIWPSFNATHHRIETFNVEVSHCISENASAAYRALCFFWWCWLSQREIPSQKLCSKIASKSTPWNLYGFRRLVPSWQRWVDTIGSYRIPWSSSFCPPGWFLLVLRDAAPPSISNGCLFFPLLVCFSMLKSP